MFNANTSIIFLLYQLLKAESHYFFYFNAERQFCKSRAVMVGE